MGFGIDEDHQDRRWPTAITWTGNITANPNFNLGLNTWQRVLDHQITFTRVMHNAMVTFRIRPGAGEHSKWESGDKYNGREPNKNAGVLYISQGATHGTVIHEVGHMLGLCHEQDRADYTGPYIRFGEFAQEKSQSYCDTYGTPFDIESVMLYEMGFPTTAPLRENPKYQKMTEPSEGDIEIIKLIYDLH